MKHYLRFWMLLLCSLVGLSSFSAVTLKNLQSGGAFRLKSGVEGKYVYEDENHKVKTRATIGNDDADLWFIKQLGGRFYIFNGKTGRSLPGSGENDASLVTVQQPHEYFIKESPASNAHFTISWKGNYENETCLHQNQAGDVVKGNANTPEHSPDNSDWVIESANVNLAEVKQRLAAAMGYHLTPQPGQKYRLVNLAYPDRCLDFSGNTVKGLSTEQAILSQIWTFEQVGSEWAIKNALTKQYIQKNANTNDVYKVGANLSSFSQTDNSNWLPTQTFQGSSTGLHCASSKDYNVLGWQNNSLASHWWLLPVSVSDEELAAAYQLHQEVEQLKSERARYNNLLSVFFKDNACTALRENYAGMQDAQLRSAMSENGLPPILQDVAVKVKNNTWNPNNSEANRFEKDFRIAEYQAYSDYKKWAQADSLMRTSFVYSALTNPTGITGKTGETALIFVDRPAPEGTTLKLQLVEGFGRNGELIELHQGVNPVSIRGNKHLYIFYNIDDVNKKLASVPKIKIHIEGLRVNGFFELNRHSNEDWKKMRKLKDEGFLQDQVLRMKSKRTCFSFHLSGVEEQEDKGEWIYDNEDKGIGGVLGLWDEISDMELDFLSVERFADRFNCLLMAASDVGLYATNHGTFYGTVSTLFSYKHLKGGGENYEGGNLWPIAHEVGHHFQQLFNIAGSLESSNNLFSNIAVWRTGRNVRRGEPHQDVINHYNSGNSWLDAGISRRMHMYWQLWLYYVELGHKPTFFKELFDKFRKEPIKAGNANTDMFRFARFCSDVAKEDLTEFFTLYGFFKQTGEELMVKWGNDFYDRSYGAKRIRIDKADIDATIKHMQQYPKKRNNLFFIDERIRPIPVTLPGVPPGTMRWGTSEKATPGDAFEVGDVGHYTDFAKGAQVAASPSTVRLVGRNVIVTAQHAVGYKVYNKAGELLMVSNRNRFPLPASADLADLIVKVGGADGADVEIIKDGKVLQQYAVEETLADPLHNTAHLMLATDLDHPEASYHINLSSDASAFLDENTHHSTSNKGKFAFFAGDKAGQYYIYSVTASKWLSYRNINEGKDKVSLVDTYAEAQPWRVIAEKQFGTTFDILPLKGERGWNWFGGKNVEHQTMGLYSIYENSSSWTLTLINQDLRLKEMILHAEAMLAKRGAGYFTDNSPARTTFRRAIDEAKTVNGFDETAFTQLRNAINTYQRGSSDIVMPEEGKVYRIRHFYHLRAITNKPVKEGSVSRKISMSDTEDNTTLWITRRAADGTLYLASAVGDGYLTCDPSVYRGDLSEQASGFTFGHGSQFGALYLRTNNASLSGSKNASHLEAISATQGGNSDKNWGTDFFFEEVEDYAYVLNVRSGANGNYATLHLPFAVILPEGVTANGVRQAGEYLSFSPLELSSSSDPVGTILPAYTPVLISASKAGEYRLKPTLTPTEVSATGLSGTIAKKVNAALDKTTHDYYALTQDDGRFVMRLIGLADLPPNRAYYAVNTGEASAQILFLEDNVTDIKASKVEPADEKDAMYDLAGRRVVMPTRTGVYIRNGKKVMKR